MKQPLRHRLSAAFSMILAGAGLWASPGLAQIDSYGSVAPGGSYLQSCSGISYGPDSLLKATCGPHNQHVQIITKYCEPGQDISFNNGRLFCAARYGTWGGDRAVPWGSYLQSCNDSYVEGMGGPNIALTSTCMGSDHVYTTKLGLKGCKMGGDIANNQGQLICSPADPPEVALKATCQHFLGRAQEYLCKTEVAYNTCLTDMSMGLVKACSWESHPNTYKKSY